MSYYELTVLTAPEFGEEEAKIIFQKILELFQGPDSKIETAKEPVKTTLGHPIKKRLEAYLFSLNFWTAAEKLPGIKKSLDGEKGILRYLIFARQPQAIVEIVKKPKITRKISEKKVELQEIEKKLDEILGKKETDEPQ